MHPHELIATVERVLPGFSWTFKTFPASVALTGVPKVRIRNIPRKRRKIDIHHHLSHGTFWARFSTGAGYWSTRCNSIEDTLRFIFRKIDSDSGDGFLGMRKWVNCNELISLMDRAGLPVLTLDQLKESLPVYKCTDPDCPNTFEGDPSDRQYCPHHATPEIYPMVLSSGIEWDEFLAEGERHCREKSWELQQLTRKGWLVGMDASSPGGYSLFPPPTERMAIANPATGSYEWAWDDILSFLNQPK